MKMRHFEIQNPQFSGGALPPPQTHPPVGRGCPTPYPLGAFDASTFAPSALNLASSRPQLLDSPRLEAVSLALRCERIVFDMTTIGSDVVMSCR